MSLEQRVPPRARPRMGAVRGGGRRRLRPVRRRARRRLRAAARPVAAPLRRLRRAVRRQLVPPGGTRPWAVPGAGLAGELRWRLRVRRAPTLTLEEYGRTVRRGEIEELLGCQLCGSDRLQPLLHPADRKRKPPRWRYRVVRCPSCGFLWRNPGVRPERLGDLYAGKYGSFLTGEYARNRRRRYELMMNTFGDVFRDGRGRRLLDFGCGAGLFLDAAYDRGFEPYGIDLSPDAIARARQKPSGRHAHVGAPLDVPEIAAGGFDVITLWSVLAHLPRPVEDLTMLRSLLAPDGLLLILTVNANSLRLKWDGDNWNGFTPNHLVFFSPTTLPLLLRRAGFRAVAMPPHYGDAIESGERRLPGWQDRLLRKTIDRGNRANMLRAVAFADAAGPARWGLQERAIGL